MADPIFNSSVYFRMTSDAYGPSRALSISVTHPLGVRLTNLGISADETENWQLFYQQGVYFLRNYNFSASYQLGINDTTTNTPVMLPTSTDLSQQWLISRWYGSNSTYRLVNRLVNQNNPNLYLGMGDQVNRPVMQTSMLGSAWTIQWNPDVGRVSDAMLVPFSNIQQPSRTSATPSLAATPTSSQTPSQTSTLQDLTNSHHMSKLDLAGFIIGAVVVVFFVVAGLLGWRRYKKLGYIGTKGVPGPVVPPRHGRAQVVQEPPPAYNAQPNASFATQAPPVAGLSAYQSRTGTRQKAADEESIELPVYGSPVVESKSFV